MTTAPERVKQFGMVGAAIGLGFIMGPALGGFVGTFNPRIPFLLAALLCSVNFLYGWFVLPESLPRSRRTARWRIVLNPFSAITNLGRFPLVSGLVVSLLCMSLAQQALQSTWVLYTSYRYNWTPLQNGLSLTVVGILTAIVQGGLVGQIAKRLGEPHTLILGLALAMTSQLLYGLSSRGWMLYAVMMAGTMGGVVGPVAQSIISRAVPGDQLGAVQGAQSSLTGLTAIVAPPAATWLFATFTAVSNPIRLPGASFFAGALTLAVGLVAAVRFLSRSKVDQLTEARPPARQSI